MHRSIRKVLRTVANYDPDYYDMYLDPNEALFSQLYLEHITRHAKTAGIQPPATILEAGCQAGRFVVPLAKLGFQVTGVDTSIFALRRARQHAKVAGVPATFVRGDVLRWLRAHPHQHYDLVLCTEVLYLSPQYREILQALAHAVRPGGLLCVSHRSKFYYLFEALKQYDLETAGQVMRSTEGAFRGSHYYNWQTAAELRALYQALGLTWVAMYPIDRFAWLTGMNPSTLSSAQRKAWLELELNEDEEAGTCARYVFVVAARPLTASSR